MNGSAVLSADGRYRYALHRDWGAGARMLWVLLNPSTADAAADDPTLRRCVGFARTHGCGGLTVVNLWAWRATDPRELVGVTDPVGPENDAHIRAVAGEATGPVVLGWGARAEPGRVATVLGLLGDRPASCLGTIRDGHPRHPLYVRAATPLRPLARRR